MKTQTITLALATVIFALVTIVLPANAETTWRIDSDDYSTVVRGQTELKCTEGLAHASFFDSSKNFVRREMTQIIAGTFEVHFFDEVNKSKLRTMRLDCMF